ncbi:hypothetical protein PAMA_016955 [Pampus argenteus]
MDGGGTESRRSEDGGWRTGKQVAGSEDGGGPEHKRSEVRDPEPALSLTTRFLLLPSCIRAGALRILRLQSTPCRPPDASQPSTLRPVHPLLPHHLLQSTSCGLPDATVSPQPSGPFTHSCHTTCSSPLPADSQTLQSPPNPPARLPTPATPPAPVHSLRTPRRYSLPPETFSPYLFPRNQ